MKKWMKSYLKLDKDIENRSYRKIVISKFILMSSFIMLSSMMLANFINDNDALFYVDLGLFIILTFLILLPGEQRKYVPHIALLAMALGILVVVFIHQGKEYTPIWTFLFIYLIMSLYGHKSGLIISIVFLATMLIILFSFTNKTVSSIEFIRFAFSSSFSLLLAYLGELFINRTFDKLIFTTKQLEELVKTDALTGLFNRRHFDKNLPKQMSMIKRSEKVLALVIIDIDHFKHYNDNFGHPAGDIALIAFANLLNTHIRRANDTIYRLGGEEFALLYQAKNKQAAKKVIEDVRVAVESLEQSAELEGHITVSAGLLCINNSLNLNSEEAYQLADKLLYSAKASGRNQVVMSEG